MLFPPKDLVEFHESVLRELLEEKVSSSRGLSKPRGVKRRTLTWERIRPDSAKTTIQQFEIHICRLPNETLTRKRNAPKAKPEISTSDPKEKQIAYRYKERPIYKHTSTKRLKRLPSRFTRLT